MPDQSARDAESVENDGEHHDRFCEQDEERRCFCDRRRLRPKTLPGGLLAHTKSVSDHLPGQPCITAGGDKVVDPAFIGGPTFKGEPQGIETRFVVLGHASRIPDVSRCPDAQSDGPEDGA